MVLDRDGVLLDFDMEAAARFFAPRLPISLWELSDRWLAWGAQQGFPRSLEEERTFFVGFWEAISDDYGVSDTIRAELRAFNYTSCLRVFPDVLPALQLARAANLRVGVLSNFALASLDESLAVTGLTPWVDVACAATVIGVSKPELGAYVITAERLGVALAQCLFFDDEPACVAGAAASGMQAYLVDRTLPAHDLAARKVVNLDALALLLA